MSEQREPFERDEFLDKPGIIGARWWQKSLEAAPDVVSRRNAVKGILFAGGALASMGVLLAVAGASSSSSNGDYRTEPKNALDMQKKFGWSFGATTESLTFDGQSKQPFDRSALAHLPDDLRPARAEHAPWYVPTLLQSPSAIPSERPQEETTPPTPLKDALVPISTAAMTIAYRRGKALASLFQGESAAAMIVVDLPGPEAVAFAAGAAEVLDPIFAVDNWPHPRGVVPAHQTLAAAAYYQPLFARHAAPVSAPPMIVLDRRRLTPYTDDASQFDNRHVARLPGAPQLKALGITRVLYVAPAGTDKELDDLNDDFVLYARVGLDVKLCGADAFGPDPSDTPTPASAAEVSMPPFYYGSSARSHLWFWHDYPWVKHAAPRGQEPVTPAMVMMGLAYSPQPRATPFSGGGTSQPRPRPDGFGMVPVVVSIATGAILGARLFRNGSWNRVPVAGGGSWGG
jgi:hypothetical protein